VSAVLYPEHLWRLPGENEKSIYIDTIKAARLHIGHETEKISSHPVLTSYISMLISRELCQLVFCKTKIAVANKIF